MSTNVVVAHRIPGRVRLAIADRQGDADYFSRLSLRFSSLDGVRHVKANAVAGSLVLEFSGELDELMRRAGAGDGFSLDLDASPGSGAHARPLPDRPAVNLVSGRELNPMFMAGVLFSAVALIQSVRGRLMVPAMTAFWYATSTFQQAGMAMMAADVSDTAAEAE